MGEVKEAVYNVFLEVWSRQVAALAATQVMTTLDGQCGFGRNGLVSFALRQRRSSEVSAFPSIVC